MMALRHPRRFAAMAAVVALLVPGGGPARGAQVKSGGPADAAAMLSGSWRLNRDLSPGLAAPAGGRRGGRPSFALGGAPQRGGRGGGASEPAMERPSVTSGEAAAQAALAAIEQVPLELKIDATADAVTFIEPRGQAFFRIDGKTANVEVPGGTIRVKCRWDGSTLRQEFSSTQRMLRRSWSVDHDGRLRLTQRVEGLAFMARESRAVFDRQ